MPDENTIRHFRNRMIETGTLKRVMKAFDWQLHKKGYIPMSGQIVDATLVPALAEASEKVTDWKEDYNRNRPHSSLGNLTTHEARNQPTDSTQNRREVGSQITHVMVLDDDAGMTAQLLGLAIGEHGLGRKAGVHDMVPKD